MASRTLKTSRDTTAARNSRRSQKKLTKQAPKSRGTLWQALTTEVPKVETAIEGLSGEEVAHDGGDLPEAYGRALWETDTNPQVGWRDGARHEIVLIADNVPHTSNVNLGIAEQFWVENLFETGEEPGGKFGIPDTQWTPGESLEFHNTLEKLAPDGGRPSFSGKDAALGRSVVV